MGKKYDKRFAVYRIYDDNMSVIYVGCTKRLQSRLMNHGIINKVRDNVSYVSVQMFKNGYIAALKEIKLIKMLMPKYNKKKQMYNYPEIEFCKFCNRFPKHLNSQQKANPRRA